ncbi:DUF3168 domain-containing protein [Yersinia enterocolitica]|uniref:tail completion protein gp17 n=1 Tax=Yersinia enterocolitica TaxID=630 RepID=UPI002866F7E0|nr:DUF3168 domain-containing protein [Yersinia enterocolitica]EKN6114761.1 DUF3168 domain-containing protein [Yersinia enterocolitica]ELZ1907737.1 DUF3168 domain-containing protein [Yersinia enterocolitica]EME3604212.1 DUF3168 domain-containing protein [Yersinia enterocolitica]HDL7964963.1 DUF3168 domain-containing protein [Yersinia enterocolitica]
MTEADIYPLIKNLVGGQVYPCIAPQKPDGSGAEISPPWVVFSLPSNVSDDVIDGQAATASMLQIDAYARTIDEARAIRREVRALIEPLSPVQMSEITNFEPDTSLFRALLEVQVWE